MAVNRQANIAVDRERIESFCRRWKVKELSIFGSALREDFTSRSDIDVMVDLKPGHGLTLYDWLDMIEELKGIFGRKVDLVAKGGLKNPFRRRQILRTAEVEDK
jgi:predicted nucleotidyltransferase